MEQGFESLGLDVRITKALAKEGFIRATEIQKQSIPQVISRSDVLVQAATGSGKTLCFALPVLHNILVSAHTHGIQALVLVPTRELCNQVGRVFTQISHFCTDCISITELGAPGASLASEAVRIRENPRIVISTPGRIVKHLKLNNLNLKESLRMLVIDEADMVLSYGYQEDLKLILSHIPSLRQTILTSATLSPEVDSLKALVLQKPVVFKLHSDALDEDGKFKLEHFYVEITERSDSDAFLFAFALLKLGVLSGKTLFFVNEIDRSYRLKLFLEAFGVTSAVLNAELPFNSRVRVLDHFNKGMFDVLIATDKGFDGEEKEDEKEEESGDEKEAKDEFGAARGIDFKVNRICRAKSSLFVECFQCDQL
jgi:ATP-dependent RNA helicase DDX56/DBP9